MTRLSWKATELTVGELSERSGVPPSALRFYEREGLITSRRTPGNQRRYTRDTLRRVAFVRVSQRVGIPLATIRTVLGLLPEGRTPTRQDWARVSQHWREDLQGRIRQLERLRDDLDDCIGCGCLSLDRCGLANPKDALGEQGPGARRLPDPPSAAKAGAAGPGQGGERPVPVPDAGCCA
ncbi:MerR family transcriptional regulator [Sphaerisporangium rufum]|uniref:MerR family transcriptional regulator n=1 Tax=Sphaerisporangium rufum TaxID=1381558 RepID=A0A919R1N2_9ACTN|nr:redox-sensitive transcriptional activator SoxR [Sphaerisporangium rufum]GII78032.1 MerR family transcriptional regulator [Sphaerisporangium rufum]